MGVLLPAGCTATPADPTPDVVATVSALPGVAEVTWNAADDGGDLTVRTDVATAGEFRDVGRAVAAALPDAREHVRERVWQDVRPGLAAVAVEVVDRREAAPLLRTVADLASSADVTSAQATRDAVSATVATADALPRLAAATVALPQPMLLLSTADQRLVVDVAPGVLDTALADVLVAVAARPDVASLSVDARAATDGTREAWLRVQVQGDDTVAEVARALGAADWPAGRPRVHVVVASAFREQGGLLGVPEQEPADDGAPVGAPAPACTDLEVAVAGFDAALGSRYLLLRATNATPGPCLVEGRPDVAFQRASGTLVPDVETGTRTGTPAPEPLVVAPGGTVAAQLRWGAMSTALDPDVTVALLVTPVPGAATVTLDAPEGGLDVLAGAAVEIGPWQRGDGWPG